jgi:predicted RND superfamily exporter protein
MSLFLGNMWKWIVRTILRNRIVIILAIVALTAFMGFYATKVQMSYELARMLPESDSVYVKYKEFKHRFGEDGKSMFVGFADNSIYSVEKYNSLKRYCDTIKKMDGISDVVSITHLFTVKKDTTIKKFIFGPMFEGEAKNQADIDSIKKLIETNSFFDGLFFNKEKNAFVISVTFDDAKVNKKDRIAIVENVKETFDRFGQTNNIELHYSGLPYIRTVVTKMVQSELVIFILISLLICVLILILLFRSFKVIFASFILIAVVLTINFGLIALLGFKITILTGVLPSLLMIIAIENGIFLVNKYHWEFNEHGNQAKALYRMMIRIGSATFITNFTTAVGFGAFVFVSNTMLKEFGTIAFLMVMIEYVLSIILIPIIFSYLSVPSKKQLKNLDNKSVNFLLDKINYVILNYRTRIYIGVVAGLAVCIYGMTLLKTSGKLVDDIAETNPIFIDLKFFENNFNGVMPFEVSIDTKKKKGVYKISTIKRIDELQNIVLENPEFSKPVSIAEVIKFAKQTYYNGNPNKYSIPNDREKNYIFSYLPQKDNSKKNLLRSFVDSTGQYTRVSFQMADVGSKRMDELQAKIKPQIDSLFSETNYDVELTGNSVVYAKGTEFLIDNLVESVVLGILVISLIMALVFTSFSMVLIALICNLIPLIVTAAIMGFGNIPLKPSTLIIFTVALGIAIDNAILFLSRYRHEIKKNKNSDIKSTIITAMNETGISMIFSSLVLVLGFGVYMVSEFGGTQALGMLISISLFIALIFNIIVLPSLLITFDRLFSRKAIIASPEIIDIYESEDSEDDEDVETLLR